MKNIISLVLACSLFVSFGMTKTTASNTNKKKVFLFAGQSNMEGRANARQLSTDDLKRLSLVAHRIEFYYNHQPVTPLQLTTPVKEIQEIYSLTQSFGPELFFGIELAERYPNEAFIFIKLAIGGTSLYGCWNPSWSKEKAQWMEELEEPRLYDDFLEYIDQTLGNYNPKEYEIVGMLWVQGETDSGVKKWGEKPANEYGNNLRNLIERIRTDLVISQMPFVMFQVGHGKVVEGMKQIAKNDINVYLIPQSSNKESDNFYEQNPPPTGHYTAKSMKRIGTEFFKIYEVILDD